MRRHITRRDKKRKKIIIFSMISIICLFSIGYASFSSNFLVSGKGTIVEKPTTIDQLKESKVTSGDGLYEDVYEENKYIYKGGDPNNFILFNDELWRIISIEEDNTLKIIRNESIGSMAWDANETRNATTSTYCTSANELGCNAWAATSNLINTPSEFTNYFPNGNSNTDTTKLTGSVTQDASLNTYLNTEYYNEINDGKKYIDNHNFNVGTPGNYDDVEDIATDINQEAVYKWKGNVGLMNITDILRTTTVTNCNNLYVGHNENVCSNNNWLWSTSGPEWTISPSAFWHRGHVWAVYENGNIGPKDANNTYEVLPVVFLNINNLIGKGTETKPYIIVE